MKCFSIIFFIFISTLSFSQGNAWYGIVHRLPDESIGDFVSRIVIEEQDIDETDTISPWEIKHAPVEIKFGLKEDKRIVFIFKSRDEDFSEIGLLTHGSDDIYYFETFGELIYGFYPNGDTIMSLFTYDYDEDGTRELMIIGRGGEKLTDENGLTGCCIDVYSTDIYREFLGDDKKYKFSYEKVLSSVSGLNNADEVKAAIVRARINSDFALKGARDEGIKSHLKKLDSIDAKHGLKSARKIIDKVYEISFGEFSRKNLIVSFVRQIGGTEKYFTGIFGDNYNGTHSYVESGPVGINDYMEFKDYKVESIFAYDADKNGESKENELVVLISAKDVNDSKEKRYATFIGTIGYDHSMLFYQEGWEYGVHEEKTAAEIKAAIEYHDKHKYDEDYRD